MYFVCIFFNFLLSDGYGISFSASSKIYCYCFPSGSCYNEFFLFVYLFVLCGSPPPPCPWNMIYKLNALVDSYSVNLANSIWKITSLIAPVSRHGEITTKAEWSGDSQAEIV